MTDAFESPRLELFSGQPQHQVFSKMKDFLTVSEMAASKNPFSFPEGAPIELPASYEFGGSSKSSIDFFTDTDTCALLILKDGAVRYEHYALTGGRDVHWISWSIAKSFVSALIGIALKEGHIKSVAETITQYVPTLCGTAYEHVTIEDALQMSSGARWNEDYSDPNADIHRLGSAISGGSFDEFMSHITREHEPGTHNYYNSADTQALGMVIAKATGCSLTNYMHEKLWEPLGMEAPGYWILDGSGREMAFAGLNVTARDYAKLGQLYCDQGNWRGASLLSDAWVKASTTVGAPHLMPGTNMPPELPFGYGYQWWILAGDSGEYVAIGLYNQFIYVDPSRNIVIVKLSANRSFGLTNSQKNNREVETIEFFRALASNSTFDTSSDSAPVAK